MPSLVFWCRKVLEKSLFLSNAQKMTKFVTVKIDFVSEFRCQILLANLQPNYFRR